jgi:hypothetical protein
MPKGYGQDTRYVFTDKPTMPKGWEPIEDTRYKGRLERKTRIKALNKPVKDTRYVFTDKPTMPKGWEPIEDTRYVFTDKPTMPKGWIPKK